MRAPSADQIGPVSCVRSNVRRVEMPRSRSPTRRRTVDRVLDRQSDDGHRMTARSRGGDSLAYPTQQMASAIQPYQLAHRPRRVDDYQRRSAGAEEERTLLRNSLREWNGIAGQRAPGNVEGLGDQGRAIGIEHVVRWCHVDVRTARPQLPRFERAESAEQDDLSRLAVE